MSTLNFMVPSQYGSLEQYGSPAPLESQNYSMGQQQHYSGSRQQQHQPQTSSAYPTYASSPALRGHSSRTADQTAVPHYQSTQVPRSPYQQPLGSMRASPGPIGYPASSNDASSILSSPPHSYSYPALQPTIPGQNMAPLGSNSSSYPPQTGYPPASYDITYSSVPTTLYPSSTIPTYSYEATAGLAPSSPAPTPGLSSSPDQRNVRVLNSRPKPQCWEHGCNGRQFSTFSNLLRHQREKSGTAAKSYCPRCGAEFTRTTARNGHMAHEKCKARRPSDTSG
ncbi:uncharacterized protein K441DRAFT_229651 [Cenococcum geophilum 1.58]|uniref:uncharacterized protein n=1 Tax=Cenococcum geophilum 1.58 TaxID=794803 RepID=UPI00358E0169|nr:hypothetical protein K441DRAFT_229651 [Cenococcum geophilum 1.58]